MSTKIEWTHTKNEDGTITKGKTWNPTIGCTEVSPGCTNCYAAKMAWRLAHIPAMQQDYWGLTKKLPNGKIVWTGEVRSLEHKLLAPLAEKKPKKWFVDSMSDLFHKDVPFEFIDMVFAIMKATPQHTYQVLTKRADRALEYFSSDRPAKIDEQYMAMMQEPFDLPSIVCFVQKDGVEGWPLKNVWLGVSVENQKAADERIPSLLQVPAAVRFLSCEPLLGQLFISHYLLKGIHWVITGGESGHKARPMNPEWALGLRDQCEAAGVSFFFKQWGEWAHSGGNCRKSNIGEWKGEKRPTIGMDAGSRDGVHVMVKVGKAKAGRILDGRTHDQMPT